MNFKFIRHYKPVLLSEHCGRGDYASFVKSYDKIYSFVNLDAVLCAKRSFITYKDHYNSDEKSISVIVLRTSVGQLFEEFIISDQEFNRVFGKYWPVEKE